MKRFFSKGWTWEITSDPIKDVFGRDFVWARRVHRKDRQGNIVKACSYWKPNVWHLDQLPVEGKP